MAHWDHHGHCYVLLNIIPHWKSRKKLGLTNQDIISICSDSAWYAVWCAYFTCRVGGKINILKLGNLCGLQLKWYRDRYKTTFRTKFSANILFVFEKSCVELHLGGWQHHNSGFSGAYHQSIFQSNLLWDNFQKHAADQTSNQHTKQAFTTATGGGNTPTVSGKKILLINCTALPNAVWFAYFPNAERKPGIIKKK